MTEEYQGSLLGDEEAINLEEPLTLTSRHWSILAALAKARRAMTDDELVVATGVNGNSIRPRRGELVKHKYVEAAGSSRTPSGRLATRWGLTDKGLETAHG